MKISQSNDSVSNKVFRKQRDGLTGYRSVIGLFMFLVTSIAAGTVVIGQSTDYGESYGSEFQMSDTTGFYDLLEVESMGFSDMENRIRLSLFDMENDERIFYITDLWKFQAGDSLIWKDTTFDDSEWEEVSTYLTEYDLAFSDWEGYGWFRLKIEVDSTLVNKPVALLTDTHFGASEIYLNGELLYSIGEYSIYEDQAVAAIDHSPKPVVFSEQGIQVIAVRFANFQSETFLERRGMSGFRFLFGDLAYHTNLRLDETRSLFFWQTLFFGGLFAFSLIHILLFAFYPSEKRNLYFALFTGLLALFAGTVLAANSTTSPLDQITIEWLSDISWVLAIVYALRFTYSLGYERTPLQFWVFLSVGVILTLFTGMSNTIGAYLRELFVVISAFEMLRVLTGIFRSKEPGAWIIGSGLLCFLLAILFGVLINIGLATGNVASLNYIGSGILIISMSLFLSRSFALTQNRLESKLYEVKELSKRSLEQERVNQQKETEKKLLEAENNRKTHELEEARALQLTMLPKRLPDIPEWDISVFMETATEVGGDYYDYSLVKDKTLTVVLGDATGHGMQAGIMVATAKSYFHTLAGEHDNLTILKRMSSGFRNLDLRKLFMGITLLKCEKHSIVLTSAGMPPTLCYRADPGVVERITLKGLPLGTAIEYPYESSEFNVQPGDIILMMSDGLMELFNENREMLGIDRIENILKESSDGSAADIINRLTSQIDTWAGPNRNEDDITLLVMKAL